MKPIDLTSLSTEYAAKILPNGRTIMSKVHLFQHTPRVALCGYKPETGMSLQWCSHGVMEIYVSCPKCLKRYWAYQATLQRKAAVMRKASIAPIPFSGRYTAFQWSTNDQVRMIINLPKLVLNAQETQQLRYELNHLLGHKWKG